MKASGLSTTTPGSKKGKKPPVGLDTHQLSKRTAGAAGVGKRGADTKACMAARIAECDNLHQPCCSIDPSDQPSLFLMQSATSVVKRAGVNRSFTGATGGGSRGSFSRPGSSPDLANKAESEVNGRSLQTCCTHASTQINTDKQPCS